MVMIEIENIKKFMAGFLGGNLFDDFLMSEGKLSMNIAYEFDGKILKEFYDTENGKRCKCIHTSCGKKKKRRSFHLSKARKHHCHFSS